jgi:hypothetical protein
MVTAYYFLALAHLFDYQRTFGRKIRVDVIFYAKAYLIKDLPRTKVYPRPKKLEKKNYQ